MVEHERTEEPGGPVLRLRGDLDWGGRLKMEPVFETACADARGRSLTIDLRDVAFIDSTGVSLLIETSERAAAEGTDLTIVRPDPRVFRVFEVLGLDDVLPFAERAPA